MESLIPTNEYTEVDGRAYANPQVALDESNSFIDNLRATQGQQNQEITKQTQNLGTSVPTSLGGLTGAESYFTSRYQTPQTNAAVANLRATAQAAALNQALQNEQEIWKKKYQDAYRKYQKSAYDKANQPTTSNTDSENEGSVKKNVVTSGEFYGLPDTIVSETDTHWVFEDVNTHKKSYVSKDYIKQIYDDDGNVTNDGRVILDIRRMLGL